MSEVADKYLDIPLEQGIVLERRTDGSLATNVPHLVRHHSPTGYEWGYGGSGPADLALNICEAVLRELDYEGELTEPLWDGYRVFRKAYQLHQDFKWHFIGGAPREPGTFRLDYRVVESWVKARLEDE